MVLDIHISRLLANDFFVPLKVDWLISSHCDLFSSTKKPTGNDKAKPKLYKAGWSMVTYDIETRVTL